MNIEERINKLEKDIEDRFDALRVQQSIEFDSIAALHGRLMVARNKEIQKLRDEFIDKFDRIADLETKKG